MKNKYIITVTTVDGSKHYSVHKIIKKILIFLFLFIVSVLVFGFLYIKYLQKEVKQISIQKTILNQKVMMLNQKLTKLNSQIELAQNELLNKEAKLNKLSEKIDELETKMGLKGDVFISNIDIKNLSKDTINALLASVPNGKPVKRLLISSKFGWRIHPILKKREFHPGIDIKGRGTIPIYATANGIVVGAGLNPYGYGYVVKMVNAFGFVTFYAHLRKNIKVKKGQFVKKGQIVGYMGNSGLSTGQHLHYEIRYNNKPLNPIYFINWNAQNLFKIFKKERNVPWESLIKAIQALMQKKPQ
ncbi:peptidase, M23/M37 family [Nautilia profundicola AmH]|uniref:Peptidase, M23/M37 family n=1 Tax=Nautilia profundicola (strain ATCC BAA-1463 / DSM 18972 / AmH) TaxID=598659 RepID=B9L6D7_NAUPA|nr:M23 family metallopeptidase [Nautilia profundicola]ACM93388.1 peptidase, M23/M37 family [Nautilia profundicola AmH]